MPLPSSYAKPFEVITKWYPQFVSTLPSLSNKVVVITGCTSGTGFVAARTAAAKGAHVVMLNRASSRSSAAEAKLRQEYPTTNITSIPCDLQSMASVRETAKRLNAQFALQGIDVLCNNAGVMALEDKATEDGFDVQMQTNHLAHFLLTRDVFPLLEKAAGLRGQARIVNHSSMARNGRALQAKYFGQNGGNLGGNGNSIMAALFGVGGGRWERYHQSKLANVVFSLAMADKLQAAGKDKIIVASCAPGLAATNLQVTSAQDGGFTDAWMMRLSQSAEDGCMPLLHCCFGTGVQGGDFYEPKLFTGKRSPFAHAPAHTDADFSKLLALRALQACNALVTAPTL